MSGNVAVVYTGDLGGVAEAFAEAATAARVVEACEQLGSAGRSVLA